MIVKGTRQLGSFKRGIDLSPIPAEIAKKNKLIPSISVPSAPTISSITAGNAQLSVNFSAPSSNGGATITNYEYNIVPSPFWITRSPASANSPLVITGLTNSVTYIIQIAAVNSAGRGQSSNFVNATPSTVPSAPNILSATAGDTQVSITFSTENGGSSITNYEYSINNGSTWTTRSPASANSPLVITGLTNGVTYQIKLRAINTNGTGAASLATSVTPVAPTTPSAPTINSITAGSAQLSVNFSAPSSNGGATITNYQYSIDNGSTWTTRSPASTSSPLVITGLTNNTTYLVKLRAVNSVGAGTASSAVSGTPVSLTLTVNNSNGSLFSTYTTTTVNVNNMVNSNPVKLSGGSSVTSLSFNNCGYDDGFALDNTSYTTNLTSLTSLTFSSCGYYNGFTLSKTSFFTNLTSLTFSDCGYYGFNITDTSLFLNLTSLTFTGSYNGAFDNFTINDSTTILTAAKALIVLNAINNGVTYRGSITLKVSSTTAQLLSTKSQLESKGYTVTLIT